MNDSYEIVIYPCLILWENLPCYEWNIRKTNENGCSWAYYTGHSNSLEKCLKDAKEFLRIRGVIDV